MDGHDPAALTHLQDEGVGGDERERAGLGQGPGAELFDVLVEVRGHHDGLVVSRSIQQEGKPNKKLYRLTETGRGELDRWLISPAEAPYGKEPFLMRLFFMGGVSPDDAIKVLEDRRAQVLALLAVAEERLQTFADVSRSEHPDLLWWQVRLIEGFRLTNTAQLEWIDSLIASVGQGQGNEG